MKALLVGTYESSKEKALCEEQLDELQRLGDTYGLETAQKIACPIRKIDAATFIGKGKVEELRELARSEGAEVVVFDNEISPQQQRNLEKLIEKDVIDRTELILGVFAQRAHTKEARLQVELASIRYQMPRLKGLWTHLSRQRGGAHLKGEGEKQLELDKRILREKIEKLEEELAEVKKHRDTQRQARKRSRIPTFALIGYTNVGKSTLMRALTDAEVLVEDKLFATLDTTTRKYTLPNRQEILLTDTVGFIRKLPHLLVAAFKSTLEEAALSDILLHLIDVSHPSAELQALATYEVLKELGADKHPILTVLNKVDECQSRALIDRLRIRYPKTVEISALKKTGFDALLQAMTEEISRLRKVVRLRIPQSHYALASELMKEGRVLSKDYEENEILLEIEIPRELEHKVQPFITPS